MAEQDRYQKVLSHYATSTRGDFDVADFKMLDPITAHVLIQYEPRVGKPSGTDVERFFGKMFEGKVNPIIASISVKAGGSISVIAQLNTQTREIADADDKTVMTPVVAGMMYMDNQLGDVWQVRDGADGKKVLAKEAKENIDGIIASRRNKMFVTESSKISLASVTAAAREIPKGSIVKAWFQGKLQSAEVVASNGKEIAVKIGDKTVSIAAEGVVDLQKMADDAPNETAKIVKYFTEAYGDKKYASLLGKK